MSYLHIGSFPSSMTKNEKDSLRRKAKNFVVKDWLLFYRDKKKVADLQVLKCASFLFFVLSYTFFYSCDASFLMLSFVPSIILIIPPS